MRLDYTLYVLGALLLIITIIPFVAPIGAETTETKSLWIVSTVVLGLLSFGLGYTQRPKTEAQACEPVVATTQETTPEAQPAELEASKEEKTAESTKAITMKSSTSTMALTQVKGIGEKRAAQLKTLGISSVGDLSKASVATVAKKLKVSPKIVDNWITDAKKLAN